MLCPIPGLPADKTGGGAFAGFDFGGDLYKQGAPEGGGGASRPRSPRKRGPEVLSLSVGLYVKGWGDLSLLSGIPYCDISLIGRKNNWME